MSLADLVRRHDPDRFFTALFAPADRREALYTLYAFNHELARAREATHEPGLALIRLQWWREVVEGAKRAHEVATPLSALLQTGALPAAHLLCMIESREAEAVDPPATLADFLARLRLGPGSLAVAAGILLTGQTHAALQDVGTACGIAGTVRNAAALARQQRCLLPLDLLASSGLSPEEAIADPPRASAVLRPALAEHAIPLLGAARRLPRPALAAALPGVWARADLRRDDWPSPRGAGDRLAVLWAFMRGTI